MTIKLDLIHEKCCSRHYYYFCWLLIAFIWAEEKGSWCLSKTRVAKTLSGYCKMTGLTLLRAAFFLCLRTIALCGAPFLPGPFTGGIWQNMRFFKWALKTSTENFKSAFAAHACLVRFQHLAANEMRFENKTIFGGNSRLHAIVTCVLVHR